MKTELEKPGRGEAEHRDGHERWQIQFSSRPTRRPASAVLS